MQKQEITKFRRDFLILLVLAVTVLSLFLVWQRRGNVVIFDDPRLELAVREQLGIHEGVLIGQDVAGIIELDAYGMGIRRLEGIEALSALRVLNLHDNFVEDLSPLGELQHLTMLNLRNNEIYDLELVNFDQIIHLPITELSLRHNVLDLEDGSRIRVVDISILSALTELENLELRDNHIVDISPLGSLENLHTLDLSENRIEDVGPLSELRNLVMLNVRENQISDIEELSGLIALEYLNFHSNPIEKGWSVLANFRSLETLIAPNVYIGEHAENLAGLTSLVRLNLRSTALEEISFITQMAGLEILDLSENAVEDLSPLSGLIQMIELDLSENQISDLNHLQKMDKLQYLNLRENEIEDLTPIGSLFQLRYLNIHSNPVREGVAGLSNLDLLETLIMRNVRIGDDYEFLSALTSLQRLNIQNTEIASLEPLGSLMETGVLQDEILSGIVAEVNILENSFSSNEADPYAPIRPFWENITYRIPYHLPSIVD